jgi:PAS domain S-box-containing protein
LPTSSGQNGDRENQEHLHKLDFNLEAIDETSSYEPSVIDTVSRASQNTSLTTPSASRLPDFFASEVFQVVLHNPTTAHQLLKFSQSRLCGENMAFLDKVDKYNSLLNEVAKSMFEIHRDYISVNADNQINIPESLLINVNRDLKAALASTLPKLETVFVDSQNEIERLVAMDIYPRFVRHQMTMSAARALAGDRAKYAGLGDCFVLTDPAKADNPIVYASDGFVKVTGYTRNEIIPRNCRFLQCRNTDTSAVQRLREAVHSRQESVELLLNQKKSGEPFWNLLYTTPLFDATGNVVFFLGGQINCSTTIHSASDVLKILAQTNDTDESAVDGLMAPEASKNPSSLRTKFKNPFRSKPLVEPHQQPGMEDALLNRIEKMNLRKQMDTFYTAYSKVSHGHAATYVCWYHMLCHAKLCLARPLPTRYIIVIYLTDTLRPHQYLIINYTTFYISFHSPGITTMLYPTKPRAQPVLQTHNTHTLSKSRSPPHPHHNSGLGPGPGSGPATSTGSSADLAGQIVGMDIFRFLATHSTASKLGSDFKARVRTALKYGNPISLDLVLCTRRYMGFEKFVSHWTPLKNEAGEVGWVVVSLGGQE